jgi:nickel/cobalt transporter (NicO) family protein
MHALKLLLLALALLLMPLTSAAMAQADDTPKVVIDKSKLLVPPKNPDGSYKVTPFRESPVRWMQGHQQNFYRQMSSSIRALNSASPMAAGWTLMLLSFLYGVFHAAGPGHGKAVVAGWVLATENELKRGIAIAALSALFQALTAIVIVSLLLFFVQSASAMARDVAGFLESASYLMIAGLGLYLLAGVFRAAAPQSAAKSAPQSAPQSASKSAPQFELLSRPGIARGFDHVHDEICGHAHAPEPAQLRGDWSWTRAVALAFAVGLRPCTGALLVLIFSWGIGLYWAGIASTLVMALGVFITIACIAALAVYAKVAALRFAALDSRGLARSVNALRLLCGFGIALLGGLMFWASLGSSNGMM